MSINIETAVSFIGFPSSHPELDDWLQQAGQQKRLTAKDRPLATVGLDHESVQLQFTDAYEETRGPARAKGYLYLEDVTVQNGKYHEDVGAFTGTLPFGLSLDMSQAQIVETLGEPASQYEFLGAYFLTYDGTMPGVDLIVRLDRKSREISFVRFHASEVK